MSTEIPSPANENRTAQPRFSDRALTLLGQFIRKENAARQREFGNQDRFEHNDLPWDDSLSLLFSFDELEQFRGDLERLARELRDAGL
jgi:hypothetical protein